MIGSRNPVTARGGRERMASPEVRPALSIACWYLSILIPTLVFKIALLNEIYSDGGLAAMLLGIGVDPGSPSGWVSTAVFVESDVLEVFVGIVALFRAVRIVIPRRMSTAVSVTTLAAMLVLAANLYCYRQIGSFLTLGTLRNIIWWTRSDPTIVGELVTIRHLVLLVAGVAWAMGAGIVVRRASERVAVIARRPYVGVALVFFVVGTAAAARGMTAGSEPSTMGYWSRSVRTLTDGAATNPFTASVRDRSDIDSSMLRVSFPAGRPAAQSRFDLPSRPRHVVIVALETAPRKYYPITESADLPAFHRMSERAIVSDLHYTAAPFTTPAIYSIVTGTYPPTTGAMPNEFGEFRSDGLGSVLRAHGYETSYIDSYTIDWAENDVDGLLRMLGFTNRVESADDGGLRGESFYERSLLRERRSFDRALERLVRASQHGSKAFVCIATSLGHYRWRAPAEREDAPAREKVAGIVKALDRELGRFLDGLDAHGLGDDVVVVVTGDHGLRVKSEFDSLDERFPDSELTYNVPLLVYLPGVLASPRRLDCSTSHVDIAPTIFDLLGISRQSLLLHGENLLDPDLCARATFLTGAGLYPVDSLRFAERVFTRNRVTGAVRIASGEPGLTRISGDDGATAMPEVEAGRRIRDAEELFDATAALFLRRASARAGSTGAS